MPPKATINRVESNPQNERQFTNHVSDKGLITRLFANHVTDKGLISRLYRKFLKLNNQKPKQPNPNWAKNSVISPESIGQ